MGTYIDISGTMHYDEKNAGAIIQALKDLNKRDDLKRGGSYGPNSEREYWFSWTDKNYDEGLTEVDHLFSHVLGWDYSSLLVKNQVCFDFSYNDKWGQHEVFFLAIAPYLDHLFIYHNCDEADHKWILELDPVTKNIHERNVKYEFEPIEEAKTVSFEDYMPAGRME